MSFGWRPRSLPFAFATFIPLANQCLLDALAPADPVGILEPIRPHGRR